MSINRHIILLLLLKLPSYFLTPSFAEREIPGHD